MLDPFALNEKGTFDEYCLFILYSLSLQHSSFHQNSLSFPLKGFGSAYFVEKWDLVE